MEEMDLDVALIRNAVAESKKRTWLEFLNSYELHLKELYYLEGGGNLLAFEPRNVNPDPDKIKTFLRKYGIDFVWPRSISVPDEQLDELAFLQVGRSRRIVEPLMKKFKLDFAKFVESNYLLDEDEVTTEEFDHLIAKDAEILSKAHLLQGFSGSAASKLFRIMELKPGETHWSNLLREMAYVCGAMRRGVAYRQSACRKIAKAVLRHFELDRTKHERSKKEDEKNIRKLATQASREVKRFWVMIGKVVRYKQQEVTDVQKSIDLDKQLDSLVGETERYSTLLAEKLGSDRADDASTVVSESVDMLREDVASIKDEEFEEDESSVQDMLTLEGTSNTTSSEQKLASEDVADDKTGSYASGLDDNRLNQFLSRSRC